MISFTVYGEPVAQGRPRFTTIGGHVRAFDPQKSYNYKQLVRIEALKVKPQELLQKAIRLEIRACRSIPKSFSKKRQILAAQGDIRPTTKPDIDNIVKGIKDALKGVIWRDDSQVVEVIASKWYSNEPRVEIDIEGCE